MQDSVFIDQVNVQIKQINGRLFGEIIIFTIISSVGIFEKDQVTNSANEDVMFDVAVQPSCKIVCMS